MKTNEAKVTRIEHTDGITEYTVVCPAGTASDYLCAVEKSLDAKSGYEAGNKITFTVFQDECAEKPGDTLNADGSFADGEQTGTVEAMKMINSPNQQAQMLEIWGSKYGAR